MLPQGKRKPFTSRATGRSNRLDFADAKGVPVTSGVYDQFRKVSILKSPKTKHNLYIPDAYVPMPSNPTAALVGDTRQNVIRLPLSISGRHVPWTGGGYPMAEQEQYSNELRKQRYLMNKRIERYSEPVDDFVNKDMDRVDRLMDMMGRTMSSAKEGMSDQKRRA